MTGTKFSLRLPRYHPHSGLHPQLCSYQTIHSATSFVQPADFSAPPLSVRLYPQSTSDGFIVADFSGNCNY